MRNDLAGPGEVGAVKKGRPHRDRPQRRLANPSPDIAVISFELAGVSLQHRAFSARTPTVPRPAAQGGEAS